MKKDRTEIITGLLQCDLDKLDAIQALDLLETLQSQGLSPQESTEAVLMKSRILRKMCLAEKAIVVLINAGHFQCSSIRKNRHHGLYPVDNG